MPTMSASEAGNPLDRAPIRRPGRLPALAAAAMALAGAAAAHDLVPGTPQERPVLLRGGDLYTVAQGVLPAADLLFAGGRITAIGKDLAAPEGAEVVDVAGQRVYPGLIAAQTSLGLVEIGAVRATRDVAEVGPLTPEVAAHTAYNPDSEVLPTVRSHGVTTAQVVPGGRLLQGRPMIVHLDGWTKEDAALRLADGVELAWPSAAPGPGFRRRMSREERERRRDEERRLLERAFADARAYHLARAAGVAEPVDLRWEAMRPLFAAGQPLYVEADDVRDIREAVAFADEQGVRMVLVGGKEAYRVAPLLAAHQVPVILGTTTSLPMRADDDYDLPYKLPRLLADAGVRFCLSVDGSWEVRNLAFQAGQAVAFGLPEEEALRAITLSAAEILGIAAEEGSLEVGKAATLFVSRGDVLDVLGQGVTRMWIEGRAVDLDDRHKELYRKYQQKLYPFPRPAPAP